MKSIFWLLAAIALLPQARALTTFTVDHGTWNPKRTSHVFVVGHGIELGFQFLETALTRAQKIKEVYPQDQILFLWARHQDQKNDLLQAKKFANKIIESS